MTFIVSFRHFKDTPSLSYFSVFESASYLPMAAHGKEKSFVDKDLEIHYHIDTKGKFKHLIYFPIKIYFLFPINHRKSTLKAILHNTFCLKRLLVE